jgi:hypothetical protein
MTCGGVSWGSILGGCEPATEDRPTSPRGWRASRISAPSQAPPGLRPIRERNDPYPTVRCSGIGWPGGSASQRVPGFRPTRGRGPAYGILTAR